MSYRLYTIRNKHRFDTRALIEGVRLNVLDTCRNDQVHDGFTLEKDVLCLICQVIHGATAILKDVAPVGQVGNVDGADGLVVQETCVDERQSLGGVQIVFAYRTQNGIMGVLFYPGDRILGAV